MEFIKNTLQYYADNYDKFPLHDKNGNIFEENEAKPNNLGKITSQGLNEAMITLQIAHTVNNVKDYLSDELKSNIFKLFGKIYNLLKPQVDKIHNIQFYEICAIAIMGILSNNKEMMDFAFSSKYSFYQQLDLGVTADYFWYEGSFHYHLFVLKPILEVLKLAKEYRYNIPLKYQVMIKKMLLQAFKCSFNDCSLPSPNDGWPNRQLKDYYDVFKLGNQVFNNDFVEILNDIKLHKNNNQTIHCLNSGFSIIKNNYWNIFIKYQNVNCSHAHFDTLNVEIKQDNLFLTHDLSTSGYGCKLSKEYYKKTYCHNTISINGENQNINCNSIVNYYSENKLEVTSKNIYDNVNATREITINDHILTDKLIVNAQKEEIIDYLFHSDARLISKLEWIKCPNFKEYPYFTNVQKIIFPKKIIILEWLLGKKRITSEINLNNKDLYICCSPDNPNLYARTTLLIRSKSFNKEEVFSIKWTLCK